MAFKPSFNSVFVCFYGEFILNQIKVFRFGFHFNLLQLTRWIFPVAECNKFIVENDSISKESVFFCFLFVFNVSVYSQGKETRIN